MPCKAFDHLHILLDQLVSLGGLFVITFGANHCSAPFLRCGIGLNIADPVPSRGRSVSLVGSFCFWLFVWPPQRFWNRLGGVLGRVQGVTGVWGPTAHSKSDFGPKSRSHGAWRCWLGFDRLATKVGYRSLQTRYRQHPARLQKRGLRRLQTDLQA